MNAIRIVVRFGIGLVVLAISFGCTNGDTSYMPLEEGRRWTYMVRSGFNSYIDEVTVKRRLSAANTAGYEIDGSLGVSRLAWFDHALLAETVISTQFVPPLPLLYDSGETYERHWKGRVTFIENSSPATATQSQGPDDELSYGGRKIHCIRSTVHLRTAAHEIELITWYSSGLGIVQQEQRTDGTLVTRMTQLEH